MPSKQSQKTNRASIRQVSWGDVREEVRKANPELSRIIDDLNPGKKYTLYKARFPYGCNFLDQGRLYLPDKTGKMRQLTDDCFDSKIKEDLGYTGKVPALLVTKGHCEAYIELHNRTIAYMMVPSAMFSFLGIWRVLTKPPFSQHPAFLWNVCSGARSIFMLPKISVTKKHERLRDLYNIDTEVPKHLVDHGRVFQQLASSEAFDEDWFTEVLFFSVHWFDHFGDPAWQPLELHLYQKGWSSTEYWRNEFVWNMMVSLIQEHKNLKPDPYLADTVKHLLGMGLGAYVGFGAAVDDSVAPVSRLQQIYVDDYGLDQYAPVIMQPRYFSMYEASQPIYYSLDYPTTVSFSPKARRETTKMVELKDIQYLLKKYLEEMSSGRLNIDDSPQGDLPEQVQFDCLHTQGNCGERILGSQNIPQKDNGIKQMLKQYSDREFPGQSTFWRGCVRISNKEIE